MDVGTWVSLIGLALALRRDASAGKGNGGKTMPMSERRQRLRCGLAACQCDDGWIRFFEQTAMRESGFRPRAWNKSAAEKHYALQVAKRNEDRLDALGYSPFQWGFGSKGLFQILGPIAVLRSTGPRFPTAFIEEMGGPDLEFRPGVAIATAFDLARGLTHWDNFLGTWGSLNAGWGLPARMHDPKRIEKKGKQAEARAEKLGWAPGWIHEPISPIPAWATPDELAEFARAAQWAYDNCEVK